MKLSMANVKGWPVAKIIKIKAGKVKNRFTQLEMTRDKGNRYLGIYILRMSPPLSIIELIAKFVLSA